MPRLDIIIPHYHESEELMAPMFEMLRLQRNVAWSDFRVLIVNDGEENALRPDYGADMPFEVTQMSIPHAGVSAARNAGMDRSQAEWIMFCDADDAFLTTTALQTFFKFIADDKVLISCAFYEEALSKTDGRMKLLWYTGKDYIFVHGKMFRREWLIANNIRFNDALTLHEDSYFIAMARFLAGKKNTVFIKDAMYLWQYNKASETRKRDNFVLETYDHLCKKNSALADELLRRGMYLQAKGIICRMITDSYVRLNCKSWTTPENRALIRDAEDCVALFLKHYDYVFKGAGDKVIQVGLDDMRDKFIKDNNFDTEAVIPFEEWVERLRK